MPLFFTALLWFTPLAAIAAAGDSLYTAPMSAPVRGAVAALPGGGWCAGDLNGQLLCVTPQRQVRWRQFAQGPVASAPLVLGAQLIVASNAAVEGLDLASGRKLWQHKLDAQPSAPSWDSYQPDPLALNDEDLLLVHGKHALRLRAADGLLRWRSVLPATVMATPQAMHDGLGGEPAALLADTQGRLLRLNLKSGAIEAQWQVAGAEIQGRPLVERDHVWLGSRDAHLHAYDLKQAAPRWKNDHQGNWIMAAPVRLGEQIVSAESDGFMVEALRPEDGKVLWRFGLGQNVFQTPAVHAGSIYLASGHAYEAHVPGHVTALSAKGRMLWQRQLPANALSRPVVVDGHLVLGTENGQIHELALE